MSIDDLIGKKVSIRSRDYPSFELINGWLTNDRIFLNDYFISADGKKFTFDIDVVQERINNTLFI